MYDKSCECQRPTAILWRIINGRFKTIIVDVLYNIPNNRFLIIVTRIVSCEKFKWYKITHVNPICDDVTLFYISFHIFFNK